MNFKCVSAFLFPVSLLEQYFYFKDFFIIRAYSSNMTSFMALHFVEEEDLRSLGLAVSRDGVEPLTLVVVIFWMNLEGSVETCSDSNCKVETILYSL